MKQAENLSYEPKVKVIDTPKNEEYQRRVEKRYSMDYKSAISSSIRHADTSQLESLVKTIEQEDIPKDSFLDTVLYHASSMLNQIGYTNNIIESRSKRKLKKLKNSLTSQIAFTDEQLVNADYSINKLDEYISKSSFNLNEYQDDVQEKKKQLNEFEKELNDYRMVAKTSLDPRTDLFLKQAELDYDSKLEQLDNLKDTCETVFTTIHDYHSQKSNDLSSKSIFEGNKIVLNSLYDTVSLELEKVQKENPIKIISLNKSTIISAYKLQNAFLDKKNRYVSLYNQKVQSLPSDKEMASELVQKRRSQPKIKR